MYLFLMYLLSVYIYNLIIPTDNTHFYLFILFIPIFFVFYFINWSISKVTLFFVLTAFFISQVTLTLNVDPLVSNDSINYYEQTQLFTNLSDFLKYAKQNWGESSYIMFGLLYMPFYFFINIDSPQFIIILNSILSPLMVYIWFNLINKHHKKRQQSNHLVVVFLLLSPALWYFSSVLLKDVTNTFFIILSVSLFFNKKYLLSFLFLLYSYTFRPYAIIIALLYFVFIKQNQFLAISGVLFSLTYVYFVTGITGFVNSFTNLFYILFSPNPLEFTNYTIKLLPTVEAVIMIIGVLYILSNLILKKSNRKLIFITLALLIVYSCVLTLVGHYNIIGKNLEYSLFAAGDDFSRKRLPMIFLIYTTIVLVLNKEKPST